MKYLVMILAALFIVTLAVVAPVHAGGCHGVAAVQAFAVAQPVVVQSFAVQAVPVYQQQFVQAQAFAVQAAPVYVQPQAVAVAQGFSSARAVAVGGGFSRAQAIASGGFGGSALALSRVGPPRPIRNGLAILGAAIAARRSSALSLAISR